MGLKSILLSIAAASFLTSCSVAEDQGEPAKRDGWGHLRGRVVLDLELDDPRLKKHLEDVRLIRPLSLPVPLGAEPEIVTSIPSEKLIVDEKSKGVKNALVFLLKRPARVHPSYEKKKADPVRLTYAERQFRPRVFSLEVGQTLEMVADKAGGEATNFHGQFFRNKSFNVMVRPDDKPVNWSPSIAEPNTHPARIQSTIYPMAIANCLVKDHPYVTVTDDKGQFELKNLPAGTHELAIWHETVWWVARGLKVSVNADKTTTLKPSKITGDLFDKR